MRPVPTTAQMRAIDRATIDGHGLPGVVLMENAGRAVADAVARALDDGAAPPVAVVCGTGNNGGDGFVAARWLRHRGVLATVFLIGRRDDVGGDARVHLDAYEAGGGPVVAVGGARELDDLGAALGRAGVVVDAVFGTGLSRDVTGDAAGAIDRINRAAAGGAHVIAVDLPSGLDGDRGVALGVAVAPHRTLALGFLKPALAVAPGFARAGIVEVAPIGIAPELAADHGVALAVLEAADVAPQLPRRAAIDHKNRAGHVLVVAGSPGKRGAGRLAALAALRGGAGLVTLAAAGPDADIAAPDPVMTAELDADAPAAGARLAALATGMRAVAIGPGMATSPGGAALVRAALALDVALVLDADALNHVAGDLAAVVGARARVVMTPHPGEAARLLGVSVAEIEADRVAAVRALAARSGAAVVLKGARSLVVDGLVGDGLTAICPTGNAGMATAGTGDVLTGVVAALLAQGLSAGDAARVGVYLHGSAGDLARDDVGQAGMTASDVLDRVPRALRLLGRD